MTKMTFKESQTYRRKFQLNCLETYKEGEPVNYLENFIFLNWYVGSKQKGMKLDGTMKFQVKMVLTGLNSFESETLFKLCPTHEILE